MGQQVFTEAGRMLIAGGAVGNPPAATLADAKVILFQNQISPDATLQLDDLTQSTFTGYAASSLVVWDTILIGPGSIITVEGDVKEFVCSAPASESVFGAALAVHAAGGVGALDLLLAVETFDNPVPISRSGQGVRYTPHFEYP